MIYLLFVLFSHHTCFTAAHTKVTAFILYGVILRRWNTPISGIHLINILMGTSETGRTTALGSRSIDVIYVPIHARTGWKSRTNAQNPLQR